ncbi:hypothetical protein OC842_008046, partial [Tilletia horrida]
TVVPAAPEAAAAAAVAAAAAAAATPEAPAAPIAGPTAFIVDSTAVKVIAGPEAVIGLARRPAALLPRHALLGPSLFWLAVVLAAAAYLTRALVTDVEAHVAHERANKSQPPLSPSLTLSYHVLTACILTVHEWHKDGYRQRAAKNRCSIPLDVALVGCEQIRPRQTAIT